MFRNRELITEAAVLGLLCCGITAWGFSQGYGSPALGICLAFSIAHFLFTWLRYRKLRKLSEDLDNLLVRGTPLPIQDYTEGELSILSSQIQKMTLRLTEAADMLQKDKTFLADSMADISHQLRTPLTAMHLTAAMLSGPDLNDDRRRELTQELKHLLQRTQWLVEALLKMSKLDAGTVHLAAEPVAVKELIRRSAEPLAVAMELRGQQLRVFCGQEAFTGDMIWSAEALSNLLKNCMEHTPEGGTITVTAQENSLYTQIDVEDTGPGFREADIPHLFQRFYRGSSEPGYGIGLALARTIITAQNGTIRAMNTGHGAKYSVKFYHQVI